MTRVALLLCEWLVLAGGVRLSAQQKPMSAPADALGQCKDGSYVSTGSRSSACSAHGGLKIWYLDGTPNTQPGDSDAPKTSGRTATGRKVGGVPSDALGLCNDGTYVSTGSKQTACSVHSGMKRWYPDGTPNTLNR